VREFSVPDIDVTIGERVRRLTVSRQDKSCATRTPLEDRETIFLCQLRREPGGTFRAHLSLDTARLPEKTTLTLSLGVGRGGRQQSETYRVAFHVDGKDITPRDYPRATALAGGAVVGMLDEGSGIRRAMVPVLVPEDLRGNEIDIAFTPESSRAVSTRDVPYVAISVESYSAIDNSMFSVPSPRFRPIQPLR
jgi:hypothetical protein